MPMFYAISVVDKYGFIVYLKNRKNTLYVLDTQKVEIDALASFIKEKKRFIINLFLEFEFSHNIKVPITIAKSSNVKSYLLYRDR